jgi:hypothetical protein
MPKNDSGTGNPPGEYSESDLKEGSNSGASHFNQESSYRGDMNVGINEKASEVGNQPSEDKTEDITKRSNGPAIPGGE